MIGHVFHAPDEFGDEFVRTKQHVRLWTNVVVHQFRIGLADHFDEMIEGHAVVEAHCFHGHRYIIDLQNLVVVRRDQTVEGITNKAETEVAGTQSSGLLGGDQLGLTMGVFTPEAISCGFDPTVGTMGQQFAQRGFDGGVGHLGNTPVQQRDVTEQDEVSR